MSACAHIVVKGYVQGVGFRYFAYRRALLFDLCGWVKNRSGGEVELEVEGEKGEINAFIDELRVGPASAHVHDVIINWQEFRNRYTKFDITY